MLISERDAALDRVRVLENALPSIDAHTLHLANVGRETLKADAKGETVTPAEIITRAKENP